MISVQKIVYFISLALLLSNTQCGQKELNLGTRVENLRHNTVELNQKILALNDNELNDPAVGKIVLTLATLEGMATPAESMGLSFENMSIEDSILMLFQLIAQDAEDELNELLNEMKQETQRKRELRDDLQKLKEDLSNLKENIRDEFSENMAQTNPVSFDSYKKWTVLLSPFEESTLGNNNPDLSVMALPGNMTVNFTCPNFPKEASVILKNHSSGEEYIVNGRTTIASNAIIQFIPQITINEQVQNSLVYCELEVYFKGIQRPRPWLATSDELSAIATSRQEQINDFYELKGLLDVALRENKINIDDYNLHLEIVLKNMNSFGDLDWIEIDEAIESLKTQKDQLSELSEAQQLRMQLYMDRMQKAESAISNIMKKYSETTSSIIGNVK